MVYTGVFSQSVDIRNVNGVVNIPAAVTTNSLNASSVNLSLNDGVAFISGQQLVAGQVSIWDLNTDLQTRLTTTDASVNALSPHLLITDASVNTLRTQKLVTDASVNALNNINSHLLITDASVNALSGVNAHLLITDASVNTALSAPSFTADDAVGQAEGLNVVKFSNKTFGYNWTPVSGVANAVRIYCSGNGKYVVTAIYPGGGTISSDYGNTWQSIEYGFLNFAASNTGKYMMGNWSWPGANGVIVISSDYGATWANSGNLAASMAMSGSGKCMLGASSNYYVITTDYGSTWKTVNATGLTADNIACCMTPDALYMYTIRLNGTTATLYKSTNYANTWSTCATITIDTAYLHLPEIYLRTTNDGKTIVVSFPGENYIYISKDYGATFTAAIDTKRNYTGIAISGCGQYLFTAVHNGQYYVSSNGGSTWLEVASTLDNYYSLAMSNNATMMYLICPFNLQICNNVNEFPAFAAYATSQQTNIGNSVVRFNAEEFDTHGRFDTNSYQWTPGVPGYYQINANVMCRSSAGSGDAYVYLRKNGTTALKMSTRYPVSTIMPLSLSALVYLSNTDYVDIYAITSGTTDTQTTPGSSTNQAWVYFNGTFVRSA